MPSIAQLETPLLEELADGAEHSTRDLRDRLALRFGLSAAELAERTPDGRYVFHHRIQWARTHLKRRGLLTYPRRSHSRITAAGIEALAPAAAAPAPLPMATVIGPGPLEVELRALTGPAAAAEADWKAIRLLNGWGAEGVLSYAEVAHQSGRSVAELIQLGRRCRRGDVGEAPILDAVLAFACAHRFMNPDELSFHLGQLGLIWSPFSIAGIAEAARRFGRDEPWRILVRSLATSRGKGSPDDYRRLPRPFDSWFEVEVFLFLEDLGYRARAQEWVAGYRADLLIDGFATSVVIECDGEVWHRGDRADRDRAREHHLLGSGYTVLRISSADWYGRTVQTQASLRAALGELDPLRSTG
jgi:very-short-patch-repair endonuclease